MSETPAHQRFFAELKRRKVFRVAATYGAVGFVILQVAELIADGLQLPPAVRTTITIVVLLGFPVAIVLAWALERGPDGELQRTPGAMSGEIEQIVSDSRSRRWPAGLAAIAGTALLIAGGWWAFERVGGESAAGSDSLDSPVTAAVESADPAKPAGGTGVVIIPFAVQGSPDVAYLGEGMVSLLGTKLDGAGALQTVDARALMHTMEREGLEAGDTGAGAAAAAEFGARYYVVGNLVEAGGRMQITAALHDAAGDGAPTAEASVQGTEDEMFELVDQLAAELLSGLSGGPAARVRRIATVTTESLPALKAFFEGEEQFRRGQFAASVASFQRAVEEDSTFALAHYRLSIVAEWALLDAVSDASAQDAIRWADRLAPRDRRMLDAYLTRRLGDNQEAADAYRSILGSHPDEMEAWLDLSEVLFHSNPLYGRSFTESRATLDRVIEFDPNHSTALIHLARLAAYSGDLARLDTLADRFVTLNPDPSRTLEIETLQAYTGGDASKIAAVEARMPSADDVGLVLSAWSIATFPHEIDGAEHVMSLLTAPDRSFEARQLGNRWLVYLELARGKRGAAQQKLDELTRIAPGVGLEVEAYLSTMPFVPMTEAELYDVTDRLEALDPATIRPSGNPSVVFSSHDELHPLIREYLLGLLRARLGDAEAALRHAEAVRAAELPSTAGSLAEDLSQSVRAAVLYEEGRLEEARGELVGAPHSAWYGQTMVSPLFSRVGQRFLRAEILFELGRYEEAVQWYSTIGEISPPGLPYRSVALLRMSEIAEATGNTERAGMYRAAFDALWSDADPEMLAEVSG